MAFRRNSFTRGWEGSHSADPTGVHGRTSTRRDKWHVPGVSSETSKILQKLGSKAGLREEQMKRVFGAATTAPSDVRRRERGMVFGGSARAIMGGDASARPMGGSIGPTRKRVRVPRVGRGNSLPSIEPPRPQRKPADAIANEIAAIEAQQAAELRMMRAPGATRHIDESQKRRLQDSYLGDEGAAALGSRAAGGRKQMYAYGGAGGRGSPTRSPGRLPRAGATVPARRGPLPASAALEPTVLTESHHRRAAEAAAMFDKIAAEVEERQAFMVEMHRLGQGEAHEARIRRELQERVEEMEALTRIINGE
uniref:Uncharacterized protein n=1 Tax=Bicosoecida sp. CB-2014 TaxID=1486930 RepID=A0A7S1C8J6_9STRA|mmetsp:Transcript_15421/g.53558  ORF Transcript_15421/g.53558 Transcript_15421/m.53558 type:complete len:309 (+) Transcript_15421:313-1239(+)